MATESVTIDGEIFEIAPLEPPVSTRRQYKEYAITPWVAASWLRWNYNNRNERSTASDAYGSDMKSGDYLITGDSIKISRPLREGEDPNVPAGSVVLLDGQHRLSACVKTGQPFVTLIAWGLEPAVRAVVDSGTKRTFSDNLKMEGEKETGILGSLVRRVYGWDNGDRRLGTKGAVTKAQMQATLDKYPELRRSAEIASRCKSQNSNIRPTITGFAHWLFMRVEPASAPWFFERLADGADLPVGHPILKLRDRLARDKGKKFQDRVPDWRILCYYIRTWNAMLGEKTDFVFVGRNDVDKFPDVLTREQALKDAEEDALAIEQ